MKNMMKVIQFKAICRMTFYLGLLLLFLGANTSPRHDSEIPDISRRINAFTLDLLKYSAETTNAPANSVLSPQCIFRGLAMSYIASDGMTRKEMAEVFHFPDDNKQLLEDLSALRHQLHLTAEHNRVDMSIANSIWIDSTYATFRKEYVQKIQEAFKASLYSVKFKQQDRVSKEINEWISDKTHGKIRKGVSPGDFKSRSSPGIIDEPALVSVNTVYFKADWGSQFDKKSTRKLPFHVNDSTTVDTLMMRQRSLLSYSENEHVKFLEIPYIDDTYSMYAVLPKKILSVKKLMNLITIDMINGLKRNSYTHEVDVLLPKFEMKSHIGIKAILSGMGVKSPFDKHRADFDKMIIKKLDAFRIYISEIYQDTWIDVHEEGTEAAAATTTVHYSIGCSAPASPMPAQFHADHPFLFMVVHNNSQSILFSGWISDPGEFSIRQ